MALCTLHVAMMFLGASCSSTHVLNPHTSTCLRVAVKITNWHQARSHCEASGEKLAILDTNLHLTGFGTTAQTKVGQSLDSVTYHVSLLQ